MTDGGWNEMNERDFENLLKKSFSDDLPAEAVRVTPWKKAMNRILVGFALCTITLNFWGLGNILPAVGLVLSLLGFRTLRQENPWFGRCFAIAVIRLVSFFLLLILNTTIYNSNILTPTVTLGISLCHIILLLTEIFCLWCALRAVQKKAGLPPRTGGAAALMVWYGVICVLAAIQYSGWLIVIGLIVAYIFILRSLWEISREMEEAGYAVETAPVRVSDSRVVIVLAAVVLVGGALGYLLLGSYPMDWRAEERGETAEIAEIREDLTQLGFPEEILEDLTEEDLLACRGAEQVVVEAFGEPKPGLLMTGVAVGLGGEPRHWRVFHHFQWTKDPGPRGTECIQLWPAYRFISEGWAADGEVTGRVLYDEDGRTLTADYFFLGEKTATTTDFWGVQQTRTDTYAAFSLPRQGENYRGYLAYSTLEIKDGYRMDSWMNYTHQRRWWQYPVRTAMEKCMAMGWMNNEAFITMQTALQFYPK